MSNNVVIRRATLADADAVNRVMKHPDVYPHTMYDGKVSVEKFDAKDLLRHPPPIYVLIDDTDSFVGILVPENSIMWVAHDNALPEIRGKHAVQICKAMVQWMFNNTPCKKIIGYTPETNKRARVFAQICGFKLEGRIKNAHPLNGKLYDLHVVGISKEN